MQRFFGIWAERHDAPDPDKLRELGQRLDEAQQRQAARGQDARRPRQLGIAGRFATELVAALVVGGGLGWGIDWLFGHFGFHTQPGLSDLFFVLGAAAGIRNVMRAANEINAADRAAATDRGEIDPWPCNPMEQFAVKPMFAWQPLFHIGGYPIYFTNQSLLMVIVVVARVACS